LVPISAKLKYATVIQSIDIAKAFIL